MNDTFKGMADELAERSVVSTTAEGRELVFAHESMQDVTKRPDQRNHKFLRLDDLIEFAKREGGKDSAIFYNSQGITLVLDEKWSENVSFMGFEKSDAVKRWIYDKSKMSPRFTQEQLIEHLECWSEECNPSGVDIQTVIKRLIDLSLAVNITYNRKYDDQNNIRLTFNIEEKQESNTASLPKEWTLTIPVFDGSGDVDVPVRLRYEAPRKEGETPMFYFECPKLSALIEQEVEESADKLRESLKDAEISVYKGNYR